MTHPETTNLAQLDQLHAEGSEKLKRFLASPQIRTVVTTRGGAIATAGLIQGLRGRPADELATLAALAIVHVIQTEETQ